MKTSRKLATRLVLYFAMIGLLGGMIYYLLQRGKILDHARAPSGLPSDGIRAFVTGSLKAHLNDALPQLLLQVVVIIAFTQLLGTLFKKIGQPSVIGETVAGIILGPSLLGLVFPGTFHFLFPPESMDNLKFLSQIGLILFMFIVGMELDTRVIRRQALEALIISHASILIPYTLGIGLSLFIYKQYALEQASFLSFALFMGIAMSITAFPVLARIIRDRRLTGTKLGVLAITCAASDDVTAWCLLALLIAFIRSGSGLSGLLTIGLVILYALIMLVPVRLLLNKIMGIYLKNKIAYNTLMALMFTMLLFSAYCTELIGIHALFGAFLAGVIMPKNEELRKRISNRISDVTIVMLLPLFFVFTGLRTSIGLLNHGSLWITFGLIMAVAVVGKFGGSTLAARLIGQSWEDSISIGALMNTRGLMELIVLNIGYDMGVLSPEIFAMMVLMALLTTIMTSPVLRWIEKRQARSVIPAPE
ncbi:MAG TPA: cation:proton antiporter [Puia sp.]|nr:cation:proton antiporter [Puia sp.]